MGGNKNETKFNIRDWAISHLNSSIIILDFLINFNIFSLILLIHIFNEFYFFFIYKIKINILSFQNKAYRKALFTNML